MRIHVFTKALLVTVVVAFSACGGEAADEPADEAARPGGAIGSMLGASGRAQTSIMMTEMRSNLGVMEASPGSDMVGMMSAHRQRLEALISQMASDVGTRGTDAWNATLDSLRQDMANLEGASAAQLQSMMDGHARRLRRAMDLHGEITGG